VPRRVLLQGDPAEIKDGVIPGGFTGDVVLPYSGLATMTVDQMYEFYQNAGLKGSDGTHSVPFVDYRNPRTGVAQLKGQHPEFEWIYGKGGDMDWKQATMIQRDTPTGEKYNCASCHMGESEGEIAADGSKYTSHTLMSPLNNDELLKTCNADGCHNGKLEEQVIGWQEDYMTRVLASGKGVAELTDKLADAVAAAGINPGVPAAELPAELAKIAENETLKNASELNRKAVFYWDYIMVENSEGAHNPTQWSKVLDEVDKFVKEGLELLN